MTRDEVIWWVNHLFEIRKEEYFNKGMMKDAKEVEEAQRMVIETLQDRPKGEWEYHNYSDVNNKYQGYYICSVCGRYEHAKHNYCPNCGADMRGKEE